MRKNILIFTAGLVTPFALPLSRAFIIGMQRGLAEEKTRLAEARKIAQYHLHAVN